MEWYLKVLTNYAKFSGRATRQEYWMFILFNFLISLGLSIVELMLALPAVLTGLYSLFIMIPAFAVGARRLHDTGKSGWWQLISFIPFIGLIILIVFFAQDGNPHENEFGPNPKLV